VLLLGIEQLFQSCYNDNELGQAVVHAGKLLFDLEPQLFVLNETNGELTPHANNGRLPIDASYQLQQSDSIVARSLRRNEIMSSIRDSEPPVIDRQLARYYDAAGLFCAPLTWQNRPFGVLVFGIDANLGHEMAHEHDLLRGFASRVASTLWRQQQRTEQHQQASSSADEQWRSRSREFRHEINNPLAIVKNYLHVLSSRLRDETDIPREVALIQDEIDRMAALVQQYTSGETNRHTAAVDVNKLLGDLLGIINHATSGDEPITIASDLDPAVPQIASDSGLLNQALLNLLKNATEAMPNGGTIRVTSQDRIYDSDAEWVEISIADSGPGLPDHVMRDLFQPVATTKGGNHSGIGLSITYKLIAELGGRISCASNARGTQFRILLPRSLITREGDQ
jgi:signal transduction histidine kinase